MLIIFNDHDNLHDLNGSDQVMNVPKKLKKLYRLENMERLTVTMVTHY